MLSPFSTWMNKVIELFFIEINSKTLSVILISFGCSVSLRQVQTVPKNTLRLLIDKCAGLFFYPSARPNFTSHLIKQEGEKQNWLPGNLFFGQITTNLFVLFTHLIGVFCISNNLLSVSYLHIYTHCVYQLQERSCVC